MSDGIQPMATDLLAHEAALLDRRSFKEWLGLYTDDALYWVPGWSDDPKIGIAIIYDDRQRMEERIFRLVDAAAYAQMPPSRTVHVLGPISNLTEEIPGSLYRAQYSMSVAEIRPGDDLQVGLAEEHVFYANCEVTFRLSSDGTLLLQRKVIRLLTREQPLYNLTFIL